MISMHYFSVSVYFIFNSILLCLHEWFNWKCYLLNTVALLFYFVFAVSSLLKLALNYISYLNVDLSIFKKERKERKYTTTFQNARTISQNKQPYSQMMIKEHTKNKKQSVWNIQRKANMVQEIWIRHKNTKRQIKNHLSFCFPDEKNVVHFVTLCFGL